MCAWPPQPVEPHSRQGLMWSPNKGQETPMLKAAMAGYTVRYGSSCGGTMSIPGSSKEKIICHWEKIWFCYLERAGLWAGD